MGVKNLWDILESCKKTLPLHHLQNKRVCIDLSCWMVQLQNVSKSRRPQNDKLYLRGLFHRLRALIALNCSLIFVADGSIPAIKLSTYRRRLKSESEVASDETNSEKVSSLRRNTGSEFSCMIKEAKTLGSALGVPCLDGIEEGEAQCALLNLESLCDGCFSSDSDIFLFGARTVFRDICLGEGGYVVCYEMADIERKLGFGRDSLITLALLLGSDYSQGVYGLGPETASQIVKSVGDDTVLQRIASEGMSFVKKTKKSSKEGQNPKGNNKSSNVDKEINIHGSHQHTQTGNELLPVIDAYLKPKCHSADSDAVHRVLAHYPFQRAKLHQVCSQFFEWPPEKTDEYILPKIAERDLRRFDNLRSTSSALGVKPCLPKCPVKEVIKRRKFQGKECFEVSWEELDGLKTSIVPADLLESACPEKIVEFEERRRIPPVKSKRPKPKSSVAEIDQKLQALMLEIESESSTVDYSSFPSRGKMSENSNHATKLHADMENNLKGNATVESQGCPTVVKNEIIDLLSPSPVCGHNAVSRSRELEDQVTMPCYPAVAGVDGIIDLLSPSPACSRNVSRVQETDDDETTKMIELSDSETEKSPEHHRKARELRLFLARIKDNDIL